jgi:hypothetical protein
MASPLINQSDPIASINLIHDELESFKKNVDIFFLVVMGSIVFCELNWALNHIDWPGEKKRKQEIFRV